MNAVVLSWIAVGAVSGSRAVQAQHQHHSDERPAVTAPTVFLDKSPRVVDYQLRRLSNEQLLLIETGTEDPKYLPVFAAILAREGMPMANREAALQGMVDINQSHRVRELVAALLQIKESEESAVRTRDVLTSMLLKLPADELREHQAALLELTAIANPSVGAIGFAGLISCGDTQQALELAREGEHVEALLQAIALVPVAARRNEMHAFALAATAEDQPLAIRRSAIASLAFINTQQEQTFTRLADFVRDDELRSVAVTTLLSIPAKFQDAALSQALVAWLVEFAEATPAAERTADSFVDAMQLVDHLMAQVPVAAAKSFRQRLRETTVRVVRIRTVEEEMRYDLPYFAVEAGRPVQVVLINEDLMPHNWVLTQPGALKEVAELGLQTGPTGGLDGKQYVPKSEQVLFATHMVPAHEQEALTFTAPDTPGEYPYVCTFPRHWMRMYGVMVVVEDLDAWLKNPVEPQDPVGSNRQFVQSWTLEDLNADLETQFRGRSPEIGQRLFIEASCAQCHRAGELATGNVGPDLGKVHARWKGDHQAVLREIIDPSHHIDPQYTVHIILTADGQTLTGLVVAEDNETLSVLENPEAQQPTTIERSEVEAMCKTSNSMMPKGLLDRFSKDEIFEILAYIHSVQTE